MRARNRKGPNPLARVFESNGPDVKIRGTASHIAEKYVSLARDAQASGDPVAAENYLQHAEHYYRIIAAAQAQLTPAQQPFFRDDRERAEEFEGEGDEELLVNGAPVPGLGPQPILAPPQHREGGREGYQSRDHHQPRESGRDNGHGNGGGHGGGHREGGHREGPPREGNYGQQSRGEGFSNGHVGEVQSEARQDQGFEAAPQSEGGYEERGPSRRRRRGRRRGGGDAFPTEAQGSFASEPGAAEPEGETPAAGDSLTPENVD
jgi:hypothetical protein